MPLAARLSPVAERTPSSEGNGATSAEPPISRLPLPGHFPTWPRLRGSGRWALCGSTSEAAMAPGMTASLMDLLAGELREQ